MRKTLLYLAILGLLGFAVYYLLVRKNTDTPYALNEAGFTIRDTGSVGKIFIVLSDGESALVERTDSGWVFNKTYKALRSTVDLVLSTLAAQEALYPVTKNAYENVIRNLSTDGTKVEVYGRDGKKMKVFYVGGASVNNTGTNMLMEGAKMPYVVRVAGFSGYLTSRFAVETRVWRDRTIFNIPPDEIQTISLQYATKPLNSFILARKNDTDVVMTGDVNITKNLGEFNKRRAKVYLRYFSNISCEGYLNGLPDMNATLKTAPKMSTIDVTGKHGQHQHVDVYWMAINKRSKNLTMANADVPDDYDADRLYAVINNNHDTVMIQQFVFRNIFHKAFEFFQKDVPPSEHPEKEERPKNVLLHRDR